LNFVGAIIGFGNLGEINTHLIALEKDSATPKTPNLAKSTLVFLIKGLLSSLCFPYAHFPCTHLPGELMYDLVWEAVLHLETCGILSYGDNL